MGAFAAVLFAAAVATPVMAHGDHDVRPLARALVAGPYRISLWEVAPDAGVATTPQLVVLFDGQTSVPAAVVSVAVNATPVHLIQSATTRNGLETTAGVDVYDVVMVSIAEGGEVWVLDPIVVPPAPASVLPMRELILLSTPFSAFAALWAVLRTVRAWRRPTGIAGSGGTIDMLLAGRGR